MKTFRIIAGLLLTFSVSVGQPLKHPADGGNKKASVSEEIGITRVTINYDRPGVKGREGKIYGQLVHKGYEDLGFGSSKAAPWRAGANENTTIEFSTDVKIEGKELPAGKYGFFIAYNENECTLIFSKNSSSWGSYFYNQSEDALRVTSKPIALDKSVEWLKYEFMNQSDNSATIAMLWEKLMISFKVEVDLFKTQLAEYRNELRGSKGFTWDAWDQAASLCLQYNTNLEEGLKFSNTALSFEKNFNSLSTNAMINEKLGKQAKADSLMKVAMETGKMMDIHFYGRRLLNQKRSKEALEVFKFNAKKNPKNFTTFVGLARGFSASGDYKNALVNAKAALPLAPDEPNKNAVNGMIKKLEEGKDIN